MDAWERMLRDEQEALDFLLGEEFGMTAQEKREQVVREALAQARQVQFIARTQNVCTIIVKLPVK